ncbi:hypothetical protein COK67_31615 [Bacillus cereus]|uniref:Uncharacterized protein n=1 Tax=Bacillus cereus TaxID=1396 RepID=A0A9W7Q312_BACCE|nr:hypothetical protein DX932_21555 [Bacillus cereus]KAB2505782.1 hypothetical protein F8156_03850 [Bacillus cereus]PEA06634.1 hypothetical protein CON37_00575 [Bacillus cereus]PFT52719.1 hypothetical protein COK67_31615 [Bacillus cereus]TKH92373.1 hypothetical protein FC693_26210 [Bacillus cereus]
MFFQHEYLTYYQNLSIIKFHSYYFIIQIYKLYFYFFTESIQLTTRKRFIITFIPIITNSTIENRTYIWYNRNILYETMYMSLRFMKKGK